MRRKIASLLVLFGAFFLPLLACNGGGSTGADAPPVNGGSDIDPPTDPLFTHQWHITNTGQTAFSRSAGSVGSDMNMKAAINVAGIITQKPLYGSGNRSDDWRVEMQGKCQ